MKKWMMAVWAPAALMFACASASAFERTVEAFAVVTSTGVLDNPEGGTEARMRAEVAGPLYTMSLNGPEYAGRLICDVELVITKKTGAQSGVGTCEFFADRTGKGFGAFTCAGQHMLGCEGEFTITGGEGRLAGATGGGAARFKVDEWFAERATDGVQTEIAKGIAYWKTLTYRLPD